MTELNVGELSPKNILHQLSERLPQWRYTHLSRDRARTSPFYEESNFGSQNGYYQGRLIIGRDTRINTGVYLGANNREAIVVDDSYKNSELKRVYFNVINKRMKDVSQGIALSEGLLRDLLDIVQQEIPYDSNKVELFHLKQGDIADKKIALDAYIRLGAGVCRHQALLGAYVLERMIEEGRITGKVSIDRNFVRGKGGHAWIRYTRGDGAVFIVDPAQNYIGYLDDIKDNKRWFYERPSDLGIRKLVARIVSPKKEM